ncbi:type IV pilus modification protein PilV [Motiliproteus sediminis]|uniref:type IV pilus modification protein PilV n=1 Tax=Motiliproteus sediminis TaxID=1468178 RepID=UPI001AEFCE51|nr:type IV pilus modification protein PilV [Motiliproteus sediminis]
MMRQQRGVTMIEVLIAILIFGVGVLGVAGLNLSGQQTNQKAYQSLLATWKAQELVETIRANSGNVASYLNTYTSIPTTSDDCIASACNGTEIATYDLATWFSSLGDSLPSNTLGAVYAASGTDDYVVYVIWDNRDDNQSCEIAEHTPSTTLLLTCVRMEFSL